MSINISARLKSYLKVYRDVFRFFALDTWLFTFLSTLSFSQIYPYFFYYHGVYYLLAALVLLVLSLYIGYDILTYFKKDILLHRDNMGQKKLKLVISMVLIFIGGYLLSIFCRPSEVIDTKGLMIHDEIVQSKYTIKYFLEGKDPYQLSYNNTPLNLTDYYRYIEINKKLLVPNPALVTYAYLPGQFLVAVPFYQLFTAVFHWYDHRIFYVFVLLGLLFVVYRLTRNPRYRQLLLITFFFFPGFFDKIYFGFNDLQPLLLLLASLHFLKEKRIIWSVVFLGVAAASKQSVLFFIPFYLLYLFKNDYYFSSERRKKTILSLLILVTLAAAVVLPFYFWSPKDFINDVLDYQTGKSAQSYPIHGRGFSALIFSVLRLVPTVNDYYPFIIWQVIFALPVFVYCLIRQYRDNSLKNVITNYLLTLLVFWYFSRYIFINHYTYMALFLPVAYLIEAGGQEGKTANKSVG
ncbi:MAG: glycosyltransferase 87 family protein [Patescibacteria group bacterium]